MCGWRGVQSPESLLLAVRRCLKQIAQVDILDWRGWCMEEKSTQRRVDEPQGRLMMMVIFLYTFQQFYV